MPRKGENIYKRKDGRWEARYIKQRTPVGKAVYGYVYAKSYKEAKSKVQKCLIAVANSCATSVSSQQHQESSSFECVANEWYTSILPQVKESTSNKYRNLLDSYIVPLFGNISLIANLPKFLNIQWCESTYSRILLAIICSFAMIFAKEEILMIDRAMSLLQSRMDEIREMLQYIGGPTARQMEQEMDRIQKIIDAFRTNNADSDS